MNEHADLLMYIGGLIALGSISCFFVLVDYFQHRELKNEKETRTSSLALDLVISEKTAVKK